MANKGKNKERMVSVKIPRVSGESNAVFISVSERSWRVMRGVTVEIPECAYDVLRNAELADDVAAAYIEATVN